MLTRRRLMVATGLLILVALLATPRLLRASWAWRSSNPVRRGTALATGLGCMACHGPLGRGGLPDPGSRVEQVPGWTGGTWSMYVLDADEVRRYILDGKSHEPPGSSIAMPAYRDTLRHGEIEDLTAAFVVMAGMHQPPAAGGARRGLAVAQRWNCFACHGPGACGGEPNPGSFSGFIPGWYGADFLDLVRGREEFEEWIRTGSLERLNASRLARFFLRRQKLPMPAYADLTKVEIDDLWAYALWLAETGGGYKAASP